MGVSMASTSTAHTYGNVTCFIVEYIKNLLPGYFKTVHVTSTMAYRELSRINLNNHPNLLKKKKPILIIRPRVELDTDDIFLGGTYLTTRLTDQYMEHGYSNLQPFFRDDNTGMNIKFLLNRLKISYDVTIICSTQMEQINIANFLKNKVRMNLPFPVETYLESQIPKTMLDVYSKFANVPMYDENNSVSKFLNHINGKSRYPITYKMKTSTGNDEFFRYYPANLLISINGLSIDDGSKKGQVFDSFTTNFSIPVEFNTAGLYYLFHNDETVHIEINRQQDKIFEDMKESVTMVPVFTIHNLFDLPLPEGWTLYATSIFKTDKEFDEIDEVDLTVLHNQSMVEFIKYCNANGIPLEPFIKVYLMMDNKMLTEGVEYTLSEDTTLLTLRKCVPASSYRVIIHSNTAYINELMKTIHNLD